MPHGKTGYRQGLTPSAEYVSWSDVDKSLRMQQQVATRHETCRQKSRYDVFSIPASPERLEAGRRRLYDELCGHTVSKGVCFV